ncbi:molecular chaperone HtpG [Candidatus Fermentibacteria bacterium]|nr:MAG: molecular chaperone HtpG [Candidatus Fermentibacteria bacterium]
MPGHRSLKFKAETKKVLDLVINSLYSNRDIFLRELISNASDAIDRLRFLALDDDSLTSEGYAPEIVTKADKEGRTLTITDNGVGMNRDDLKVCLGTVASSGTLKFLEDAASGAVKPELIGQFGVGFYSAFMVADSVTVKTRKAGETDCWIWKSTGEEEYTIGEGSGFETGTSVILHMKEDAEEYLSEWKIRSLVSHYSDFVGNPVFLEKAGDAEEGTEKEQLNKGMPVWLRNPSEVEDSEYSAFYSHLTHDHSEPMDRFWYHGEGTTEFHALIFTPATRGMDLMIPDRRPGLSLYARKVMIMERADTILPRYLHFFRGVVESPDVSLNVSREMLQQDRVLLTISKVLTRKIIDHLSDMMDDEPERYREFFAQYGDFLKEGVYSDYERKEELASLLMFHLAGSEEMKSLSSISESVHEEGTISYLAGASLEELRNSPHLESAGDDPVIFLYGPVDLIAVEALGEFKGRKLVNLASEATESTMSQEMKTAREEAEKEHSTLMTSIREILGNRVAGVRFSPRLRETPCILVSSQDDPGEMMRMMMRAMNQEQPQSKKVLELNPSHPLIESLETLQKSDDDLFKEKVGMVLELARVLSGLKPEDPAAFGRFVASQMVN